MYLFYRLSSTHDKISKSSDEKWRLHRTKATKQFMLLNERSPCSMLPTPLNLVTVAVSSVDWLRTCFPNSDKDSDKEIICISGTVADLISGFMMSFIAPLLEVIGYVKHFINAHKVTESIGSIAKVVFCLPLIYCFYVCNLLVSVCSLRTYVIKDEDKYKSFYLPHFI